MAPRPVRRHDRDRTSDQKGRLGPRARYQIRTREDLRVPLLHEEIERRRQGDRAVERPNRPGQSRRPYGFEEGNRGRDKVRRRLALDGLRAVKLNSQVRCRRLVDFQHVDLDIDQTVGQRVEPVDELPVAGQIGAGESASPVEDGLCGDRVGRVAADDDVASAVGIDSDPARPWNRRDRALHVAEVLRDRDRVDDNGLVGPCR